MEEKASKKLLGVERERVHLTAVPVVLPAKRHGVVGHVDEPVVGDGSNTQTEPVGQAPRPRIADLGIYPAAVPAPDGLVWGEVYAMADADTVIAALDDIEGYRTDDPDKSLYSRQQTDVRLPDGSTARAWVYFYNAPLGQAPRIPSGDYLEHVKVR